MRRADPFGFLAALSDEEIHEILDKRARVRELRADGHSQEAIARMVGVTLNSVRTMCPGEIGLRVPVAPLREAFLASGMTAGQVGKAMGWWRKRYGCEYGDAARVKRTLGIQADRSNGRVAYRKMVDAETVMLMAEAMNVNPWSVLPDDPNSIPPGDLAMVAA